MHFPFSRFLVAASQRENTAGQDRPNWPSFLQAVSSQPIFSPCHFPSSGPPLCLSQPLNSNASTTPAWLAGKLPLLGQPANTPGHYHISPLSIDPAVARMARRSLAAASSLSLLRSSRSIEYLLLPSLRAFLSSQCYYRLCLLLSAYHRSSLTAQLRPIPLGPAHHVWEQFSSASSLTVRLLKHAVHSRQGA